MVAVQGHVIEVGPFEFACRRSVQEETVHVGSFAGGSGGEPIQPVERVQVAITVTQGRGRYDTKNRPDKPKKDIWLRPLRRDWKRILNR